MRRPSDPLSPDAQAVFGQALDDVCSSILKRADEERQQTQPWKDLFKASEEGLRGLLSESERQMTSIVLNTSKMITAKFGIRCSNKLFRLIQALPYAMLCARDKIHEEQGLSCCADKARQVYYQEVMDEIKKLIEEQADAQKDS